MLYNPKWNDDWSLHNLISWLETKDPKAKYRYTSCNSCVIAQYLLSRGWKDPNVGPCGVHEGDENMRLPRYWEEIAIGDNQDWTFGGALKRAMKYV